MSYVAPDGNTYKYKISGQGSSDGNYSMDIYSNPRICLLNVSGDYRAIGLNSDNTACGWITAISGSHASRIIGAMYPSTVSNDSCLSIIYYTNGSTSGIGGNWSGKYNVTYNSSIYVASSMEDAYAYLTAPDVFQIPSFSFSGSILPGQNSSLSQGSCSLTSPYTTSFSFEGKYKEFVEMFYDDMMSHNPFVNGLATMEKNATNLSQLQTIIEAWKTNSTKHLSVHFTGSNGAYDSDDPYQIWRPKNAIIFILANAFSAGSYVGGDYDQTVYPVYVFNGSTWSTYTSSYGHRIIVRKPAATTDYYTDFNTYSNYMS